MTGRTSREVIAGSSPEHETWCISHAKMIDWCRHEPSKCLKMTTVASPSPRVA